MIVYLCIDHDHITDRIRGLLHSSCNVILGLAEEDANSLRRAADYLEKANATTAE